MQVSVSELKNHLSLYLHKIQAGKNVIVLSHRKPIALLSAIEQKKNNDILSKNIIIEYKWNGKKPKGLKHKPSFEGDTASNSVLEDRR
jgi:antitoxin (DNA-binding transcriptional repressor) of toxin-antitoxin stability system